MEKYRIAVVIWEDHYHVNQGELPEDLDDIKPTLTVGIVLKETEKALILAHDVEPYEDISYSVILKHAILGIKEYGEIELNHPTIKG